MRETRFSIVKALAILCVVLSHAGVSGWFYNFIFLFHVPVFFLCSGYFFNTRYLSDERTFIKHRVRGLYVPFVKWSVFFLIFHNLFFKLGILSEHFGNAAGGVTHPFTWTQFSQHLWNIFLTMSGYDVFLLGAFWFFRALLVSSLAFLVLFKLLNRTEQFRTNYRKTAWAICIGALLLGLWKTGCNLTVATLPQGGSRELMGVAFMAFGFLLRQYDVCNRLTWRTALPAAILTGLFAAFLPSSMSWKPTMQQFLSLPLPAVCGFLMLVYVSTWLDKGSNLVKRALVYVGNHTLHIFAFHLVAFKLVSALKVAAYDLPWEAVGQHPYIHTPANNVLWILLYALAGIALPLLWLAAYRKIAAHSQDISDVALAAADFSLHYGSIGAAATGKFLVKAAKATGRGTRALFSSIKQSIKDILAASSIKDE